MTRQQQQKRHPFNDSTLRAQVAPGKRAFAPDADQLLPEAQAQPEQAAPQAAHSIAGAPVRVGRGRLLQPKLKLGAPGDRYEDEAERVAEQVMRAPVASAGQTPPRIQRAATGDASNELAPEVEASVAGLSGGQPLDAPTRALMEPRFGHDFSQVRIHHGPSAAGMAEQLQARAFTVGNNVAFAPGQYQPGSADGQRLLAHELTHVVQQGQDVVRRDPGDDDVMLQVGSRGEAVRRAQELLNQHGAEPPLVVDGIFGPKTLAATQAFQLQRNLVVDGIIGPFTWRALASAALAQGQQTGFDQVAGGGVNAADAPDQLDLPEAVVRGMQQAWDQSLPGGQAQEQGGVIVRNPDGSYGWHAGSPGDEGSFSPNYGDVGAQETLVGTGHTHPYAEHEGGFTDVAFSGQDIASLVFDADPVSVVQSGQTLFVVVRTSEFAAMVDALDDEGKEQLFNTINEEWDELFKNLPGELPERAQAAAQQICSRYSLVYYRGTKGSVQRQ